jgi:uncharacterized protein YbjT (DUF2867 family)
LVEAAMASGVSQFIYISTRTNIPDCALSTAKRTVEDRIKGGCMTYTILRPSFLMEVWLSPFLGFDYPNAQARIYGSGDNPSSWISCVDVARFAVMAVDQPVARNAILELGGPEKLSPNQVVQCFEQASGKSFRLDYVPLEAIQAQRSAATDPLQQSVAALMLTYANGDPVEMRETLEAFPLKLASIHDYVVQTAAAIP